MALSVVTINAAIAAALTAATSLIALPAEAQQPERPLRLVLNVGLQTLDPVAGPTFVTRNFSYMVFDTLVAVDSQGRYRPQMLENWRTSDDGLIWTFTLRDGLEFSDGAPVTAEDCVASLRRWGARDSLGRRLMAATKEMRAVDTRTFVLELSRPFGLILEALGKPSVQVPFIMPARLAANTPPTTPVAEVVGSGPFLFLRDQWIPGERAVFARNPRYRPRDEPADGLAGGKVPKMERVEFINMSDPGLRTAAIQRGEVDYLEYAPIDYIPVIQGDRNLVLSRARGGAEIVGGISINYHQPPFDNVLVRRAVQQIMERNEIIAAEGVPAELSRPDCRSLYACGTFYASETGTEPMRNTDIERARELLRQAGYKGERVVVMQPSDSPLINPIGLVMIDRLKQAGFNLDVQTSDWSSLAQRWIQRRPVDQGGWSLLPIIYTGFDLANPLSNPSIGYNCTDNQPWGYCVPEMTRVIERFEAEGDAERRREIAGELQRISMDQAIFPLAGQFASPAVWRAELRGVVDFGFPVLWNIERSGR
ncbi:ABC transporter substrate-binding protein [Pseudoroseomonas wenyumeiae]|uniref:ABC transporter substrate-binding protein n=1 Tax=Teichococcus wenyumeiae TaxID=2478470 RepID=A0A3A9JAM3_9PROT|nr:ABC transporter substrate-binding protein [Pseudoroseomonas wenyumeiae]RKK03512.1 ABC transporter substrate-binding protein [Pseudoroseomonas wenyumeiae]RMI17010.1 ABC transporter substrate-binding protein [Pseudoroseomonas wenyumeiae]